MSEHPRYLQFYQEMQKLYIVGLEAFFENRGHQNTLVYIEL